METNKYLYLMDYSDGTIHKFIIDQNENIDDFEHYIESLGFDSSYCYYMVSGLNCKLN